MAILALVLWLSRPAWSGLAGLPLTIRAGTLGLRGEPADSIFSGLDSRLGATFLQFDPRNEISHAKYDLDLDMQTFPFVVDWYPFGNWFHLSGGIIVNQTDMDLNARANTPLTIGSTIYPTSQLGAVHGNLTFNRVAPYLGLGWGTAFDRGRRWGFLCDIGVAFFGSPRVSLSAAGPLASDPAFQRDLARERASLEDDLSDFKLYPVISLSLYYRF